MQAQGERQEQEQGLDLLKDREWEVMETRPEMIRVRSSKRDALWIFPVRKKAQINARVLEVSGVSLAEFFVNLGQNRAELEKFLASLKSSVD